MCVLQFEALLKGWIKRGLLDLSLLHRGGGEACPGQHFHHYKRIAQAYSNDGGEEKKLMIM